MSCNIEICNIPLCCPNLTIGYLVNVPSADVFISFKDIATGAIKWVAAETDELCLLTTDVTELTEWLSPNKIYEISVHQAEGNSCPDYCINALTVDGGEVEANTLIAGFIKVNTEVEEYTLRIK